MADNPTKGECLPNMLCERHGDKTSADIVDLDGVNLKTVDAKAWAKATSASYLRFAWLPCNNALAHGKLWKFPTKRRAWCSKSERKMLNRFLRGDL